MTGRTFSVPDARRPAGLGRVVAGSARHESGLPAHTRNSGERYAARCYGRAP